VTTAVAKGDLSKKITADVRGELLELKSHHQYDGDQLNGFMSEVSARRRKRWAPTASSAARRTCRAWPAVWKDLTENVNQLAANLTGQVRGIASVVNAVANGDLSKKITVDVKGEILELSSPSTPWVDQLNAFAAEVTRVARESGHEGKLGGQAQVAAWGRRNDLTANVNSMARTSPARCERRERGERVAHGDLTRKLTVEAKGEVAALAAPSTA